MFRSPLRGKNTTEIWNKLPRNTQSQNKWDFKSSMKTIFKPPRYKYFSKGSKLGNTLLTRIRVGRSDLNQHRFTIRLVESPECICHFRSESPEHYFLDCFLYLPECQILFGLIEHYVPFVQSFQKRKTTSWGWAVPSSAQLKLGSRHKLAWADSSTSCGWN